MPRETRFQRRQRIARRNLGALAVADRLALAAQSLLDDYAKLAQTSFREWDGGAWLWDDDVWARNDPTTFPLAKALRDELEVFATARQATR